MPECGVVPSADAPHPEMDVYDDTMCGEPAALPQCSLFRIKFFTFFPLPHCRPPELSLSLLHLCADEVNQLSWKATRAKKRQLLQLARAVRRQPAPSARQRRQLGSNARQRAAVAATRAVRRQSAPSARHRRQLESNARQKAAVAATGARR